MPAAITPVDAPLCVRTAIRGSNDDGVDKANISIEKVRERNREHDTGRDRRKNNKRKIRPLNRWHSPCADASPTAAGRDGEMPARAGR